MEAVQHSKTAIMPKPTGLFEEAAANKYEDPYLYVFRKQAYFGSGDTAKGVEVIKEGFQ